MHAAIHSPIYRCFARCEEQGGNAQFINEIMLHSLKLNVVPAKAEREVTKLLTSINRAALNSHGLLPCYTVREEANRCSTVRGAPQYGEEWTVRSIGRVKRTNTSGSSAVQGCNSGGGVHSKLAGVCAVQQGERGRISADG